MSVFLRPYGVVAVIDGIVLIARGVADYRVNPTLATGDVKVSKNGGAFANLTTLPTVTPAGDTSVRVDLSATEMQAARIVVRFIDQTNPKEWEDQELLIETYGHASAQLPIDLHNTVNLGLTSLPSVVPGVESGLPTLDSNLRVKAVSEVVSDKAGYALSSSGLDAVAAPAEVSSNAQARGSFVGMFRSLFNRFHNRVEQTLTEQRLFKDDGTTAYVTRTVSSDGTTQVVGTTT
jgi:hypothetical protein